MANMTMVWIVRGMAIKPMVDFLRSVITILDMAVRFANHAPRFRSRIADHCAVAMETARADVLRANAPRIIGIEPVKV